MISLKLFAIILNIRSSNAFSVSPKNHCQIQVGSAKSVDLERNSMCSSTTCRIMKSSPMLKGKNDNDDDFIDPFISPHAYSKKGKDDSENREEEEEEWTPFQMNSVKDDFKGASQDDYKTEKSLFTNDWSASTNAIDKDPGNAEEMESNNDAFDPLLSPHAYASGTDSKPIIKTDPTESKIGILLIDHGSRRASSNELLLEIAQLYQTRTSSTVKAAHMEIAPPSIMDQFRAFKEEGVTKIVCHPYFLSPGRHVTEDIPELIEEATKDVNEGEENDTQIEVITTKPVGSNLDRMVGLISNMVDQAIGLDSSFISREQKGNNELGGLFGEIQRMMDEQL